MKSGLYVLPGASATACAAAAASSFDLPITNVWKLYRSLSGVVPMLAAVAVAALSRGRRPSLAGRARARRRAPEDPRVWIRSIRRRIDRAHRESGDRRRVRWAP